MKSGKHMMILGLAILALAVVIVVSKGPKPDGGIHGGTQAKEISSNLRNRDRVSGSPAERKERLRSIFLGKKSDQITLDDIKLMRSLPAEALMGLLDELGTGSGPESLIIAMIKRLGEIEENSALEWLSGHGVDWFSRFPQNQFKQWVLMGWAERDAPAALAKMLDPDFYGGFAPWSPDGKGLVAPPPAGLVEKAAAKDPEGTWKLLRQYRKKDLGARFFANLDPALAKGYALRLTELFRDPDRPGLEIFGGLENDPAEVVTADSHANAAKQAAAGWFVNEPDAALAWYVKQCPLLENNGNELGEKAGGLIGRLVDQSPDKAMDWARAQKPEVRAGLAGDVAGAITARRNFTEDDMSRLNEAFAWMDRNHRLEWLARTARIQRWQAAAPGAETSPAEQITTGLKMSAEEATALAKTLAADAGTK